jgi:hypothetical protein
VDLYSTLSEVLGQERCSVQLQKDCLPKCLVQSYGELLGKANRQRSFSFLKLAFDNTRIGVKYLCQAGLIEEQGG